MAEHDTEEDRRDAEARDPGGRPRHRGRRMWLTLLLAIVAVYAGVVAMVAALQTRMIFPAGVAAAGAVPLPPDARLLRFDGGDGVALAAVHRPPDPSAASNTDAPAPPDAAILGFGGNAWDASALAQVLHDLFPAHHVVAVHYRGYPPSEGTPGAAGIMADAVAAHDHVAETLGLPRVVAVGFSIGSGPAAHLAAHRRLAGLILVTPFDSLAALARHHYPWAPVKLLLRHRMPVAELVRRSTAPTALIAAERDAVVPPARTAPLRAAVPELVLDRTVTGADHNDLYDRPAFAAAMREALARFEPGASALP